MFEFLALPERTAKPRRSGLTHVIDTGYSLDEVRQLMSVASGLVDIVKLAWGTALVTPHLREKVELYRSHGIPTCFGGTLFELCLWQNKLEDYLRVVRDLGMDYVEVSNGTISMEQESKLALLRRLCCEFRVLSEVGSKNASVVLSPAVWVDSIKREREAGAWKVIAEGRESATGGIYDLGGHIKEGLIHAITSEIDVDDLLFEAPLRSKQSWLVNRFGANVNLGNVAPEDVVGLETLRLGGHSDTLLRFH